MTEFSLTVKAEDHGTSSLAAFCTFGVRVGDRNDNPPVFNLPHYTTCVEERSPVGRRVKQVGFIIPLIERCIISANNTAQLMFSWVSFKHDKTLLLVVKT